MAHIQFIKDFLLLALNGASSMDVDEDSAEAAVNNQLAAAAHLDQIEADISRIVEEAKQHVEQVRSEEAAATAALIKSESSTPPPRAESRIPISAPLNFSSSSPQSANKTKTIKKHSKVVSKSVVRPAVGNIEWDAVPDTTSIPTTELSSLLLEDVTSPNEHESSEPVVILSPGDDYSGEIDEVILIQTPGDDADIDEDEDGGDDGTGFSPQRQRIITTTTTTTTTRTTNIDGDQPVLPQLTFSTTDDELPTISLSLHSDSEEGDEDCVRIEEETFISEQSHPQRFTTSQSKVTTHHQTQSVNQHPVDRLVTFGSSSGSDVALHEPGAEPSDDDEPGMLSLE